MILSKKDNEEPIYRILDNEEYLEKLYEKLDEEIKEYLYEEDVEELADILDVIYSIIKAKNLSIEDVELIRKKKADKKGSFDQKIFLEKTNKIN